MRPQTSPKLRRHFFERHQAGMTYPQLAQLHGVSTECVRYWCRRQRDGGSCYSTYAKRRPARLRSFHPRVRYVIIRLRLEHPGWGPRSMRLQLAKRPSLQGLPLPSIASIGRYLSQWSQLRQPHRPQPAPHRPPAAKRVHQRWQMDFKLRIKLDDGTRCNLFTVHDPVGKACIGGYLYATTTQGSQTGKITCEQTRSVLRQCFTEWSTCPEELQTDGEAALVTQSPDAFPSLFTLWLAGLGIQHRVTRPGRPTDNAGVERCHRTLHDYVIRGNEHLSLAELQVALSTAIDELRAELPSRARGCNGRPPLLAYPELQRPRRSYQPEREVAQFDLRRVDAYLANLSWERRVDRQGRITLGGQHQCYKVGQRYAGHIVRVCFDPSDRHFIYYDLDDPARCIGRQPARDLTEARITGQPTWPDGLGPQQLPLPLPLLQGVNC
jgi:transposase InsO family protein